MTTYYKLVRPNYTSFHDDKFKWPKKGIVEVKDAVQNGPCGKGLHLARTVKDGCLYARFPFRILKVKPLSPILGKDGSKIRVAKAESLGEIPIPQWAKRMEKRIKEIPKEMKAIPWFKGGDVEKAKKLVRLHFKLLVPFGFSSELKIEVIDDWDATRDATWAAARGSDWDAAWDAAREAAWDAARGAARGAVWDAARESAWDAARDAAWDAAWDAARGAARGAVWDAARESAWGAAWDAARDSAWDAAWDSAWDDAKDVVKDVVKDTSSDLLKQKNPFKPILRVYKEGGWPLGFVDGTFKLFMPKKTGDQ